MSSDQLVRNSTPKARPGGRTERNRQAVADAVLACVRQGRIDFEIQEIATLSGVHRTTISRRWPDRGALMAEAMREHVGQFSVALTGDWETDVRRISQGLFEFFAKPTELAMNRTLAISENIAFHEMMTEHWMPVLRTLQEPMRRAKAAGLIKPDVDEELVIIMLSSTATVFTALSRLPIDPGLPVRLADQIISLCRPTIAAGVEGAAKRQRAAG